MANPADTAPMRLAEHGAECHHGAVTAHIDALQAILAALPPDHAGIRITGIRDLDPYLGTTGPIGAVAARVLGVASRPVRALLFDKTTATNWSLGWHQDRTICVRCRVETPGFGPWSRKQGLQHVAPPFDLLTRMVTLRVHLDDVRATNAPLRVAPGSHRCGLVRTSDIDTVIRNCGERICTATAGDVWMYATPILHASDAALHPARRRVLQIDFAAEDLPGNLKWLGI